MARGTFESFSYEWTTFDRIKPEDHDVWARWFADVPWADLTDARALDAGCGRGQFALFSARRKSLRWTAAISREQPCCTI